MDKRKGYYSGTEIDEKWWKRYRRDRLFARGSGEYWRDDRGIYFLRFLTKEPIFIPMEKIIGIKLGKWHAGRWAWGMDIFKVVWLDEDRRLSSGFVIHGENDEARQLRDVLAGKIKVSEG